MTTAASQFRVLHVVTHLAVGGAERIALNLARGLRPEFQPAIFAVHGVREDDVGRGMWQELSEAEIPIFTGTSLALKRGGVALVAWSARRAVAAFRPHLVHLHTEIPEFAWAATRTLGAPASTVPLVRTVHNSEYWHHWPRLGRWTDRHLSRATIACVSKGAVIAFERLRRTSGAIPTTAKIIFNGIGTPTPSEIAARRDGTTLRLLFAGRFEAQKGVDLLPEIITAVTLPSGRTAELVLHGGGKYERALREFAKHSPPGWTIRVCPPAAELSRIMSSFDALLMPSRFEGLSLIAIEAMLLGVPVIATDAPGLREQMPPGHPWIAASGDARGFATVLERALHHASTRTESAGVAQAFAKRNFAPEAMLTAYRQLYRVAVTG